jgi:hypothetical protein
VRFTPQFVRALHLELFTRSSNLTRLDFSFEDISTPASLRSDGVAGIRRDNQPESPE